VRVEFYTHLLAYEDGTGRMFRNVGIKISDAGESPKRKHTNKISLPNLALKQLLSAVTSLEAHFSHIQRNRSATAVFLLGTAE